MADKNDGGDKTEKPTPKRLKDARKKGDVPKSRDVSSTAVLAFWLLIIGISISYIGERIVAIAEASVTLTSGDFNYHLKNIGQEAFDSLVFISALLMVPIILFGLLIEFFQVGAVMTLEKIKPKMEHLNPAEGIKRMFSMDNLIEVIKSIAKTALLFFIGWLVLKSFLPQLILMPQTDPSSIIEGIWAMGFKLFMWTVGIFSFVAILDSAYQNFSFTKKMRMSMRDIKQEMKDSEGDPMIKQQRRQTHQEWSEQGAISAASNANALIVNPTHIAIALDYDKEVSPVPKIAAKGQDEIALKMREAAEDAGVPIVRNIELARTLLKNSKEGHVVPRELFDIIAETILWAQEVKQEVEKQKQGQTHKSEERQHAPPGEDLTHYPRDKHFS